MNSHVELTRMRRQTVAKVSIYQDIQPTTSLCSTDKYLQKHESDKPRRVMGVVEKEFCNWLGTAGRFRSISA